MLPVRVIGIDLLKAYIRAYAVLWPGCAPYKTIGELSVCLQGCEQRLREWQHSLA